MAQTPWGKSDYCQEENAGIKFYGTPSHGGYYVPAKVNRLLPVFMRLENGRDGAGWYEEDCDWCLPVVHLGTSYFPNITYKSLAQAWETFKNWHPGAFEQYTGTQLKEGESYIRDEELFKARTRSQWVVVAAVGQDDGTVLCNAYLGGRATKGWAHGEERIFLVPGSEYKTRGRFGFVIDLDRHQEIKKAV
jgi:hypothetical protein